MKAITVKQPWASLIVHGIKDIENRTWPCPKRYIGKRVLIHASSSPVKMVNPNNIFSKQQWDSLSMGLQREIICGYNEPTSAIIGSVEMGVYNWVLANSITYNEPIENVKGKLSFWDYSGIKEVKIECPECGSIEIAVEDYTTAPFPTYLHRCNKCEYVIMESEWNVIK